MVIDAFGVRRIAVHYGGGKPRHIVQQCVMGTHRDLMTFNYAESVVDGNVHLGM